MSKKMVVRKNSLVEEMYLKRDLLFGTQVSFLTLKRR